MSASRSTVALLAPEMVSRGGVQAFMWRIWECMRHIAPEGGDLALSVLNDGAEALRSSGRMPVHSTVVGACRSKLRFVVQSLRLPRVGALIVGHVGQSPVALLMKRLGRARGYVVILHGLEAWRRLSALERLACRDALYVVATTVHTASVFSERNAIPFERIRVVPLCTEEAATAPSRLELTGVFRILIVGRQSTAERYKGFAELIGAVAIMRAAGVPATLHIVGDGDDQPFLRRRAADRGVAGHVVFHGLLDDADLQAAYASCDVYAMPSRDEGFGIAFLEAMRHAKPCVGADSGGIPDVVENGKTGLLVPYGDENALAAALTRLFEDPQLRERLGVCGRERREARFSFKAFCASYSGLINEVTKT